ncbi:hypothetical protein [uncultured Oscillibacter sp.]|uniref:hypothetical protein n=1 Tax=uncultured Oscillibacter sp. TaxID=876091 RepID=UPI0025FEFC2F|nr:hypothetical protein [uncultured Oscillibacter sp.]
MYSYEITSTPLSPHSPVLYGILVRERQGDGWVTVAAAAPFSADRRAVSRLAETCTRLQLPPEHLADAAAAFFAWFSTLRGGHDQ